MIDVTDAGFRNVVLFMRQLARDLLRPAGLEADRRGEPLSTDHPLFVQWGRLGLQLGTLREPGTGRGGESRAARSAILAAEELAYGDQGALMSLPGPGLGGPPLQMLGTDEQQERFLKAPFADPERPAWGAYATTEAGCGSDVARIATTARRDGDAYVINGNKMFITNGARASWVVVFATVDPAAGRAGQRAFVVERGTPGLGVLRIEKKMGLTASETAGLYFEDCRVSAANLLGGGFRAAMATFDLTRPMVAAMAVGIARCALERAAELAREAFGRPPARAEQLLLGRLAEARRRVDAARLLCWRAAWKMDRRETNTVEASMAKVCAPPAALFATNVALDIAGLGGVVDPLIEKCFRDVKVFDIFEGTGEIQRVVLARRLFGYP